MTSSVRTISHLLNRSLHRAIWIALMCISIAVAIWKTMPSTIAQDSWLHLGVGRFILEQKRIPTHTDISFKSTAPALEWVTDSWLSDMAFYIAAHPSNPVGLVLIQSVFLILTSIILFDIGMILGIPIQLLALLVCFGALISQSFWRIHPLMFATPVLLLMARTHIRNSVLGITSFRAFIIILATILLANGAGGFAFLGIGLSVMYAGSYLLHAFLERASGTRIVRTAKTCGIIVVGSFLALLFTPNGMRLPIYNVTMLGLLNSRKWYSTLGGALESANSSIIKNAPNGDLFIATLIFMIILTGLVSYVLLTQGKKTIQSLFPILPLVPFAFLPLLWIRLIPLAVFMSLPVLGMLITHLVSLIPKHGNRHDTLYRVVCVVGSLVCITLGMHRQASSPIRYPSEQLDFMTANQLPEPVLTSTDLVGYVYWRLYPSKGFIDALDAMFDEHDTIAVYSAFDPVTSEEMKTLEDSYHFASVLVTKENDYLTGHYSTNANWTLYYLDYNGILFSKNDALPDIFIRQKGLSAIDFSQNLGVRTGQLAQAITELEQFTKEYPTSILAVGQLASLYRFNNQPGKAEQVLLNIPQREWDFVVKTEMGRIKAAQGLCKQSEHWFLEALKDRNEQNVSRTTFDLAVLYAICLHDMEKAKHYFKRYSSYPIPKEERERATQLMKKYIQDLDINDL